MRLRRPEPHTLAGAYAVDALAGADQARFERHLARCAACARELGELREATARLAGAAAVDPPAGLIERVIAATAQTRQLPPPAGQAAAGRVLRGARRTGAGLVPVRGLWWRVLLPRFSLALAAVSLTAAAATGAAVLRAEHELSQTGLRDAAIAQVLNAPDAVIVTARAHSGGAATVVLSRLDHSLVFTTAGLPPLPSGSCYQLWLMGPGGERSAGMLPAQLRRMTSPVIASGLTAGDRVALTVEPDGGSPQPTSAPLLMLSLPA
jgi:anti-sigma-K factor RskA